eukprot:gene4166-7476_t
MEENKQQQQFETNEMNVSLEPNDEINEQDRFLPIANVVKIMRRGLPEATKVSKEGKECAQECVSEFISFVTSEASDRCLQEKRKTINGEDIIYALATLGFDNYLEPLKIYLQRYREYSKMDKGSMTKWEQ